MRRPSAQRSMRIIFIAALGATIFCTWLHYSSTLSSIKRRPGQEALHLTTSVHAHSLDTGAKQHIATYVGVMGPILLHGRNPSFNVLYTGYTDATNYNGKYDYRLRRKTLRATWFPADEDAHQSWAAQGLVIRFVIGQPPSSIQALSAGRDEAQEVAEGNDFLLLPIPETYGGLPFKVLSFLRTVLKLYSCQYIFKVDDDIYFRLDRVLPAVMQWQREKADYVGCMKQGQVFADPGLRWYEPQHALLGGHYFTHCWGSAYVLSYAAARLVAEVPEGHLRFFSNEDVTVGSWMMAFNLTHFDDRRMCETKCSRSSLVVYDYPECAGLCDPAKQLKELHASTDCHLPALDKQKGEVPMLRSIFHFAAVPQLTMQQQE